MVNGFDIDGVITIGIFPGPNDVIITGRSFEEEEETLKMLHERGIYNLVFFNPVTFEEKTRKSSGEWKAWAIADLEDRLGVKIENFFEDDSIQVQAITRVCPNLNVIEIAHDLTEKENVRHDA